MLVAVPWVVVENAPANGNGKGHFWNRKKQAEERRKLPSSSGCFRPRLCTKSSTACGRIRFNVNPDPRYLFLTRHTEEALACLTYGIQSRKGFVLLTGEVGTGKTTLINKLLEWLRLQQVATAFIFNSRLNTTQFLDYMMADFGIPGDSKSKTRFCCGSTTGCWTATVRARPRC